MGASRWPFWRKTKKSLHFPLYQMIIDMCVCGLERVGGKSLVDGLAETFDRQAD